jgi:ubiquitin carboxyl-terminal hydrolase 25/28
VQWNTPTQANAYELREWGRDPDPKWPTSYDNPEYYWHTTSSKIPIDGRDEEEEKRWWDPTVREIHARPGPGILPPILGEWLHNPEHSLFSISVTPPDFKPAEFQESREPSLDGHTPASSSFSHQTAPPPSADEVRTAVPHPNAYYCTKDNGWVLLLWKSSSVFPPLAKSFQASQHPPFPDQTRRKRTGSCIGDDEQPFGLANKTHHFHVYKKAVDARNLNPPFYRSEWEKVAKVKNIRRTKTIHMEAYDSQKLQTLADDKMDEEVEEEEGDLLDLYVCCQCSFYCVASSLIPGVISRRLLDELIRDKREHPAVGKTKEMTLYYTVDTILK